MFFKKETIDLKEVNKARLNKKIEEYEEQFERMSRMELSYNINKIIEEYFKTWRSTCNDYNLKYNTNIFEFVSYEFNKQKEYDYEDFEALYDETYENDPKYCDNIIVEKCGFDNIARYRALINLYRKIRLLTYAEEDLISDKEKEYRKQFETLDKSERPDIVWCTKSRFKELSSRIIDEKLYLIINSIKNLDYSTLMNYQLIIDEYIGLPNYLLLLLFNSIDDYPDTKKLNGKEFPIEYFIEEIFENMIYSCRKLEYDELDLNEMLIKYSKSNRKKIYEKIINKLIEKNGEFTTRLCFAIMHHISEKEVLCKDIENLLNIESVKLSVISSMRNHHRVYELCLQERIDTLKFVLESERIENGELFLNRNNLEFLSREKGEVLTAEDGNWIYTVPTITIKIKDAIEKNVKIPKQIKDYVLNKIND